MLQGSDKRKDSVQIQLSTHWYLHRHLPVVRSEESLCLSSEILHALGSPVQALSTFLEGDESHICPVSHLQMYFTVSQITIDACAVKLSH